MIVDEYIVSLSDSKLIELEDFLTNNFGDIWTKWTMIGLRFLSLLGLVLFYL